MCDWQHRPWVQNVWASHTRVMPLADPNMALGHACFPHTPATGVLSGMRGGRLTGAVCHTHAQHATRHVYVPLSIPVIVRPRVCPPPPPSRHGWGCMSSMQVCRTPCIVHALPMQGIIQRHAGWHNGMHLQDTTTEIGQPRPNPLG